MLQIKDVIKIVDNAELIKIIWYAIQEVLNRGLNQFQDENFKNMFLVGCQVEEMSESELYDLLEKVLNEINKRKRMENKNG